MKGSMEGELAQLKDLLAKTVKDHEQKLTCVYRRCVLRTVLRIALAKRQHQHTA